MKLDLTFPNLVALAHAMKAPIVTWQSGQDALAKPDIKDMLLAGIEVQLKDLQTAPNGQLTLKNEPVLLYIKDSQQDKDTLLHDTEKAHKFHLADCVTLEGMRKKGRYERYIATQNTSGQFKIDYLDRATGATREVKSALKVCRHCLSRLNIEKYKINPPVGKTKIRDKFNIEAFFTTSKTYFKSLPKYTDKTAPASGYASNWDQISKDFRRSKHWICEQCSVDLSTKPSLSHTHHCNGNKSDNSPRNLKCLCVLCHAAQPHHNNMYIESKQKIDILNLRLQT